MKNQIIHELPQVSAQSQFSSDPTAVRVIFIGQTEKGEAHLAPGSLTEIQDIVKHKVFVGAAKTNTFIRNSYIEKENIAVVGVGSKSKFSTEQARQSGAIFYSRMSAEKITDVGLDFDSLMKAFSKSQAEAFLNAFIEGYMLASYTFVKYKSVPPKNGYKTETLSLVSTSKAIHKTLNELAQRALHTVDCIFVARDLSNEPANVGTPTYYANEISKLAKAHGLKVKVMGEAEARKEKMNLFLGVSKGSAQEPKCVILEYTPKTNAKKAKTVALVGKGVTFDSGGISLKPGLKMEDMKHDMSGASTMVGTTLLAARLGCKNKIVTVMVFCENMPSGTAQCPSHIITGRNGKTVELINTDAEGRLILADALDLAQDYKPDVMVDAATLTGACSVALGKLASALFSNDSKLTAKLLEAGNSTDEKLWELPLWDEYFEDMKSHYADMMNSVNDSNGGTIRGAMFMKQFIRPGQKWAHLDIANAANDLGYLPYNPRKGATGKYVKTLAEFVNGF